MAKITDNAETTAFSDKEVTDKGPESESVDTAENTHVPAESILGKTENPSWTKDRTSHFTLNGDVDSRSSSVNASDSDTQQIIAETIDENLDIVSGEMKRLVNTGGNTAGPNTTRTAGNVNTPRAADGSTVLTEGDGVTDAVNRDDLAFREDHQTGTMPTDNCGRSVAGQNQITPVKTENNNVTTWNSEFDEPTAVKEKIKSYSDESSSGNHGKTTNGSLDEGHEENGSIYDNAESSNSDECREGCSPLLKQENNPPRKNEDLVHTDQCPASRGEIAPYKADSPSDGGESPSESDDSGDSSATEDFEYPPRPNAESDKADEHEMSENHNGGQVNYDGPKDTFSAREDVSGVHQTGDVKKIGEDSDGEAEMGCNLNQEPSAPNGTVEDTGVSDSVRCADVDTATPAVTDEAADGAASESEQDAEAVTPDTTTAGDAATESADTGLVLSVECGLNKGLFYMDKLMSGSKGACVLFDKSWFTPNEFQYISGRETAKDWKRSIKHFSKSLKLLIAKGLLTVVPATCKCEGCLGNIKESGDGSDCDQVAPPVDKLTKEQAASKDKPAPACDSDSDRGGADTKHSSVLANNSDGSAEVKSTGKKQRKRKSKSTKSELSEKKAKTSSSSVLDQNIAPNMDIQDHKAPNVPDRNDGESDDVKPNLSVPVSPAVEEVVPPELKQSVPLPATRPMIIDSKTHRRRDSSDSLKGPTQAAGGDARGLLQKVKLERTSPLPSEVDKSETQSEEIKESLQDRTGTFLSPGKQARLSGILNELNSYKKQLIQKLHTNNNNINTAGSSDSSGSADNSGSESGSDSSSDSSSDADSGSNPTVPPSGCGALFSILNKAKESHGATAANSGESKSSTSSLPVSTSQTSQLPGLMTSSTINSQLSSAPITQTSATLHYHGKSSSSPNNVIPSSKYSHSQFTVSTSHKTNSSGSVVKSSVKDSQAGQQHGLPSTSEAASAAGGNNMFFVPPVNPFPYTLIPGYGIISTCLVPGGFYGGIPVPFSGPLPYKDSKAEIGPPAVISAPAATYADSSLAVPAATTVADSQRKASQSHSSSEVNPTTFLPLSSAGSCNNTPAHQNHSSKTQRRENNRLHGSWTSNKHDYVCDNSGALDLRVGAKRQLSGEHKSRADDTMGGAKYARLENKRAEKENVVLDLTVRNPK